jgi:RND family efflux transporter MFP subunit
MSRHFTLSRVGVRPGAEHIIGLVAALALTVACRASEGTGLPPPTGSGAPPAASIPKLEDMGTAAPGASASAAPSAAWTGTLYAKNEAALGPKNSGVLVQVAVDEGDRVKKGQLVFRVDPSQASLGVNQAKTAVASASVALDAAKIDYARAAELIKGGSISPASYDQAKASYDRAGAALDQSKAALQSAQKMLADTSIYSPIDGVVTSKLKSVGEAVTMTPPTVVLEINDVDHLELHANLPERALAVIKERTMLRISASTVGIERTVPGKRINPTIDLRTRTVEVVADVDNKDERLKVGMLVDVAPADGAAAPSAVEDAKIAAEPRAPSP